EQLHLRRGDITFDAAGQIDGAPGLERVVAAGKYIGILGEGFAYIELPVSSPKDVLSVELADLEGDGRQSLVVRTVERGNGGSREVLAVSHVKDGQIGRLFAHEIGKQLGAARLANVWQLVPRRKGKGLDLVIKPGPVAGFTAETWREMPAGDMVPILLP